MHPLYPLIRRTLALPELRLSSDDAENKRKLATVFDLLKAEDGDKFTKRPKILFMTAMQSRVESTLLEPDFSHDERMQILVYLDAWYELGQKTLQYNTELSRIGKTILDSDLVCEMLIPLTVSMLPPEHDLLVRLDEKITVALNFIQSGEMYYYMMHLHSAIHAKKDGTVEEVVEPKILAMKKAFHEYADQKMLNIILNMKEISINFLSEIIREITLLKEKTTSPILVSLEDKRIKVLQCINILENEEMTPSNILRTFSETFLIHFSAEASLKMKQSLDNDIFNLFDAFFVKKNLSEDLFFREGFELALLVNEERLLISENFHQPSEAKLS